MPRGPPITDLERGQRLAVYKEYISFHNIAEIFHPSGSAVQGALCQTLNYKAPKNWKGNCKFSETRKRALFRMASNEEDVEPTIQAEIKLPIANMRV